ncbi:uncharacterized protein B0T23DRAFT_441136 [Neurospora hispaniola]|uniref:Uncharacterized protein n=1 Tax=Neurospora hispaniola TaxID=588809 RepID=A0AAJ0MT11_9PEZI|nr:hypothetical protein B0T23DRAFT_441136 [Neurospora hispaniola]
MDDFMLDRGELGMIYRALGWKGPTKDRIIGKDGVVEEDEIARQLDEVQRIRRRTMEWAANGDERRKERKLREMKKMEEKKEEVEAREERKLRRVEKRRKRRREAEKELRRANRQIEKDKKEMRQKRRDITKRRKKAMEEADPTEYEIEEDSDNESAEEDSDNEIAEKDANKKINKKDDKKNAKAQRIEMIQKLEKVEEEKAKPSLEVSYNQVPGSAKDQRTRKPETTRPLVEGCSPLPCASPQSSSGVTRGSEPKKKQRRVSWASPVLTRVKIIEAREVPEPKEGQSKSEYRPPFVSEDGGRERSVTETPSQRRRSNPPSLTVEPPLSPRSPVLSEKEPWIPSSLTVEPPLSPRSPSFIQNKPASPSSLVVEPPSSPRSLSPLQEGCSSQPSLTVEPPSSPPNPLPHRKDKEPSRYSSVTVEPPSSPRSPLLQVWKSFSPFLASPAPKHSLDQHGTQTRAEEVLSASLKRHGAIKVRNTPSGRICIPNGRKDHQTFNSQQRPSAARNHKSQPTFGAKTNSPRLAQPIPIRPQTVVSFKERLAFFESQLAPRGSSSTASFHTARTHQPKSGSGGIPSDTSSTPSSSSSSSSFFTARTHQSDSDTSPEGGASTVSSSLSSTKAQYLRSAYSERWDEFLAHSSLGLPSKYTGPGIRYRFCGCSSCVWAKTSEWKRGE